MNANAATDRWFRSADWDEASQAAFTAKLARARPHNRYQYRRIKTLALLEARDRARQAAGRALLEENLALRTFRHTSGPWHSEPSLGMT